MAAEAGNVKYCWSSLREAKVEVSRIYDDDYLLLKEDPVAWIQSHPAAADRLSVRILELNWLHVEKITDMIGELSELTHLYFYWCLYLKCLPDTITRLSNLQLLQLEGCNKLEELPENLGELESLTHLSISYCRGIKSLPNSLANLTNLTTLDLKYCKPLRKLPPNLNVVHLIIKCCCSIKALPTGLSNLASLHLTQCNWCLANLKDSLNLRHLTLESCHCNVHADVIEFLPNLDELLQLSLVDIEDTKVRYLPSRITKLLNLQILCLPRDFMLETLPYHLNDSVIICMEDCHVRKTWKELKTEIEVKNLGISMSVPRNHSRYLWSDAKNNSTLLWMQNNYDFQPSVIFLDLEFMDDEFGVRTLLKKLTNVTHLYISGDVDLRRLPDTLTNITHLSLHDYHTDDSCKSLLDRLAESSNLVSLDVDLSKIYLPSNIHQFVNLKCLTVRYANSKPLVPDNWEKLSNLKSLVLYRCYVSLPTHLNLTNLKLFNCFFKNVSLLPTSLHRLELWHSKNYCCENRYCSKEPIEAIVCLNQLVNLKTLSITCYKYTSNLLPSIAGLRNLKELQLKDCFGLKELPPDLDELVELSILNISGTRIKSFPDCITKLQKLKHVILPKCFRKENLPNNSKTKYITDDTDEEYYKHRGYYSSEYETSNITSDEINEITVVDSAEIADKVVSEYSQEGIIAQQISPHQLLSIPNANQFLGDYCLLGRSDTIGESSQDQEIETSGLSSDTHEMNISNRIFETEYGIPSLDWYISPCVNNIARVKNSHHASESTQSRNNPQSDDKQRKRQKKEIIHEKNPCLMDKNTTQVHLGKELSELYHNGGEDAVDGTSYRASCGSPDQDMENMPVGNDKDSTSTIVGRGRGKKIEIKLNREELQSYWSRNMTVEDVAEEIGVSRSTFKRWLKASDIKWQSSRISKSQCANNKNTNTASFSGSKPAQVNCHEHAPECLSDANERIVVNNLSLAVTMDIVEEPGVATRCHSNGREQASDTLVGTNQGTRQESPNLSKLKVKATYKKDDYSIELSSTPSFHELEKGVAQTIKLEMGKFKIKYKDEDNEWMRMTIDFHLKQLMDLSRSSGKNVIRLSVIDL